MTGSRESKVESRRPKATGLCPSTFDLRLSTIGLPAALPFGAWPSRRWWLAVVLVVAGQFALVLWLGDATRAVPRRSDHEPAIALAPGLSVALLEELNPTLFAWSGPRGFSGPAWLRVAPPANQAYEWTEPARFLALDPKQLSSQPVGAEGRPARPRTEWGPGRVAEMRLPFAAWAGSALPTKSSVCVEGELAGRPLLRSLEPPSRPVNDLLPNTEIRVLVDAAGLVRSAILVASSAQPAADAIALELARGARFETLAEVPWQTGKLIFRWYTVPATPAPEARP